jgi:hypothetical protein
VPPLSLLVAAALALAEAVPAAQETAPGREAPDPDRDPRSWLVPAAHAGGVLLGMRVSSSVLWPDAYDPTRLGPERDQLRLAYTRPPELRSGGALLESDGDPAWLNGLGHGLFGSEVYGRTRQCGHGALAAFLATTAASVAWEYGLEAPHKRPSAVDLVWTPLAGGALGEARFRLHRWLKHRRSAAWLLFAVDPFGETERRVLRTRC